RSDHQQPDYQHHQMHTAVIATEVVLTKSLPNATIQTDYLKVLAHQLQTAIRSQLLAPEFNPQVSPDHPPQPRYPQTHPRALPFWLRVALARTLIYAREASFLQSLRLVSKKFFSL